MSNEFQTFTLLSELGKPGSDITLRKATINSFNECIFRPRKLTKKEAKKAIRAWNQKHEAQHKECLRTANWFDRLF